MAPCAEILILFFDALMLDDAQLLQKMLRRFPLLGKKADTLTFEERDELSPPTLMTNHFYTYKSSSTCVDFGVVLPDTAFARKLVSKCNLDDFVYWGANTDPGAGRDRPRSGGFAWAWSSTRRARTGRSRRGARRVARPA